MRAAMMRWAATVLMVLAIAGCSGDGFPDDIISRPTVGVDLDPSRLFCPASETNDEFC